MRNSLNFVNWKERKALISEVTEAVMEEVRAWQSRPLDPVYPIVYLDALIVKMRQEGRVENRAVFVASGNPFSPSTQAIRMSCTPRLRNSVRICSHSLAPSVALEATGQ